jgi:hypothetical protein
MENHTFDDFLRALGEAVSQQAVIDNLQSVYNQFTEIRESLKARNDFPLNEGDTSNMYNHLAEYCFRASFFAPNFRELAILAYEDWYEAMLRSENDKEKRTLHKGMPLHQLGALSSQSQVLAKRYFLLASIEDVQEVLSGKRASYNYAIPHCQDKNRPTLRMNSAVQQMDVHHER